MMRILSPLFVLFSALVMAGDYQPDPAVKYSFVASSEATTSATPAEDRWIESLKANLIKAGSSPNVVYRFRRSTANLAINGLPQGDLVFVSRDDPDVYFVVEDNYARFIINFRSREVSASNYGGSIFIPPSKTFAVLILDKRHWPPGGIPIDSAPGNKATFEGRSVSWH
jgi:hypothetical protein